MKTIFIILFTVFVWLGVEAQTNNSLINTIDFNGYIQVRASTNFVDNSNFSLRRLKLWVKSKPEFSKHWSYKIQTTFSSLLQEKFFLQDVQVGYKAGLFWFDIGQFVPQYSLQRFQPDFSIPAIERAKVVNALIPDGTLGVRDLGVQANFRTKNKLFETHLGFFNGYGIKEYRFNNRGYMITNKSAVNIPVGNNKISAGYSLQYRYAENLQLRFVFPDSIRFTGNDFRYNLFALFVSRYFVLQGEYLNADFDGKHADGFYIVGSVNIKKNQVVLSAEQYNDLIDTTHDEPYFRVGYNYLIKDYKIKFSLDNYFQLVDGSIENYFASIQFQIFLK